MTSPQTLCCAVLAMSLAAVACSAIETSKANDELAATLRPLMGKSVETVYERLGAPDSRKKIDNEEIWFYYKSYGLRSATTTRELPGNVSGGRPAESDSAIEPATGARSAREAFDRYSITFVDGVAVRWEGQAAR